MTQALVTLPDAGAARLGAADLGFFASEGFLVVRGLLDPGAMARAREIVWEELPAGFRRDDPGSWRGVVEDESGRATLRERIGRVKLRGDLRVDPFLLDLLPRNPRVLAVGEQLLGRGRILEPRTVRGLYLTFPGCARGLPETPGHVDTFPFSLGLVGYLDDVAVGAGAFTVWPRSHRVLRDSFECEAFCPPTERLDGDVLGLLSGPGVEIPGRAGDVIFWDHRLQHAAGRNRGARPRQAILADYRHRALAPFLVRAET